MAACKLDPVNTAACDWKATPGQVTLELKSVKGNVAFEPKSTYSGGPITFDSSTRISFTIVAGKSMLDIAYVFSDTTNGAGTLHEVCDTNTILDDVNAATPGVQYNICT
jgi:hypothetical protein